MFFAHLISFSWVSNLRQIPCRDRMRKRDVAFSVPSPRIHYFTAFPPIAILVALVSSISLGNACRQSALCWAKSIESNDESYALDGEPQCFLSPSPTRPHAFTASSCFSHTWLLLLFSFCSSCPAPLNSIWCTTAYATETTVNTKCFFFSSMSSQSPTKLVVLFTLLAVLRCD